MRKYFLGLLWFMLSLVVCVINDGLMKYLGDDYVPSQIVCLRYFFASLSLLLIAFFRKNLRGCLISKRYRLHGVRAVFLFVAILLYCAALHKLPISTVIALNFVIPLFTLLFAYCFLKEHIGHDRFLATLIGFVGVCVIFEPYNDDFATSYAILLLLSSALFAILDVVNKKYVTSEGPFTMVFYTAIFTFLISLPFAIISWELPSALDWILFIGVGIGANLLLYCILKAFEYVDVSALAPFRYLELILSALVGYYIFNEFPSIATIVGAMIIIPCTLYIVYSETRRSN